MAERVGRWEEDGIISWQVVSWDALGQVDKCWSTILKCRVVQKPRFFILCHKWIFSKTWPALTWGYLSFCSPTRHAYSTTLLQKLLCFLEPMGVLHNIQDRSHILFLNAEFWKTFGPKGKGSGIVDLNTTPQTGESSRFKPFVVSPQHAGINLTSVCQWFLHYVSGQIGQKGQSWKIG